MSFDGSGYHGFQSQPDGNTIQQTIEKALFRITGAHTPITGCGRTDAGVHALNYCFNFHTDSTIPAENFPLALNSYLPESIAVKSCALVKPDFHAGFDAVKKTYLYKIVNSRIRDPFFRGYGWFFPAELDLEKMTAASAFFLGEHDFKAFMAVGGSVKTTVRRIYSVDISKNNDIIETAVTGNGFLYNMVRIIVGTLADVGLGKIPPERIKEIIDGKDRTKAGRTAPPEGLYLKEVFYE